MPINSLVIRSIKVSAEQAATGWKPTYDFQSDINPDALNRRTGPLPWLLHIQGQHFSALGYRTLPSLVKDDHALEGL